MAKQARGTVKYRPGRDGRPGAWFGRFTASDGSRPWVELGPWSNSPQGRARAKETAAHHAPRFKAEGFVATPQRGPKAKALRIGAPAWWGDYFKHRAALGFDSNEGVYRTHIQPALDKAWIEITPTDCEHLRDALDAKALEGKASPKTVFNAWTVFTTAAKAAAGQWKKDKPKKLRVRLDNPCVGIAPPDLDDAKELQWLYPDEFLQLVSCKLVPLEARRLYVLATYLFVRAGELKALDWSDVDIERGIVSIRVAWDRDTGEIKQTKTGNKGIRRFAIEAKLLPLLRAMHVAANGAGPVITMRQQKWWATDLRKHLGAAQIKRAALFRNDATCKRLRFHDLRGTGLTWMAIRGDDVLKIQQRAGHTSFEMTQRYIRTAEAVGEVIGDVFPALPASLLSPLNGLANRLKDPQAVDFVVEAPGIEADSGQPEITMEHQSGTISTDADPASVSDRAPKRANRSWRCDGIARGVRAVQRGRDGVGAGPGFGGGGEAVGRRDADRRRAAQAWERLRVDHGIVGHPEALVEGVRSVGSLAARGFVYGAS